jgi:hypothetical protein
LSVTSCQFKIEWQPLGGCYSRKAAHCMFAAKVWRCAPFVLWFEKPVREELQRGRDPASFAGRPRQTKRTPLLAAA